MSTSSPRRLRRAAAGISAGTLALSGFAAGFAAFASPASATASFAFTRIAGTDRYATSAQVAQAGFPSATQAILASGETGHFPDALAGNYLAGNLKAPVLLTQQAVTPTVVLNALKAMGVKTLTVLGGPNAVSDSQLNTLRTQGFIVNRIGGQTRYDTAKMVDEQAGQTVGSTGTPAKKTAIVATGQDFADALSAGAIAYKNNFPVVLTTPGSLSPQAKQTLTDLGIQQVIIAGGTSAVSTATEQAINSNGQTTLYRAAGNVRSETSRLIANFALSNLGFSTTQFAVASGATTLGGADALSGGPYAGMNNEPILVTDNVSAPGSVVTFATEHAGTENKGVIFGGLNAVSQSAEDAITAAAKSQSFQVTSSSTSVTAGQPATISVSGAPANTALTFSVPANCGTVNPSTVTTDANGNASTTFTSSSTASGSCTITVTAPNGQTASTTVTVTPSQAVTNLPQLISAQVISTNASNTTSPGTVVRYTFSKPVNTATAGNFLIYPSNWDGTQNTNGTPGAGTNPKLTGNSVASFTPGSTTVDVNFAAVTNTQPTTTTNNVTTTNAPNSVVTNYTLATVRQNAVTTSTGTTNPEGAQPIGTSQTSTTQFAANKTTQPDLTGVTIGGTGATSTSTAVTFTFDQPAYLNPAAVNPNGAMGSASGGTAPGFYLVLPNNTEVTCATPTAGSATQPGGTQPGGGTGQNSVTVLCPNAGTNYTSATVARAFVGPNTVSDTSANAGSVTKSNPLEAFHFGQNTTGPDLTSVQLVPASTGSNTSTTQDAVIYTFDQAVAAPTATQYGAFLADATRVHGVNAAGNPTVNGSTVVVYFPKGTLTSSANPATGAFVESGGATATSNAQANLPDELGLTPSNATSSTTPGVVNAPQLQSVSVVKTTTITNATSYSAVYTFNEPVTPATQGNFFLYAQDGTRYTGTGCTAGGTTATLNQVTCTTYAGGTIAGNANGQAEIYNAVLGTVLQDAVTGNNTASATNTSPAANANPNPEGAANTTKK